MAVAGLHTNNRQAPLLQLDCELGFTLGRLALREFQSRFDNLAAQFFEAGFPGGGADGEVTVGAVGEAFGLEDVAGLLDEVVVEAVDEEGASVGAVWPGTGVAFGLADGSFDRAEDFDGVQRDLERRAGFEVVGDGDLNFAEHGLDLPQVGGCFLRVERFQFKLGARGFFGAFRGHLAACCIDWSSGQVAEDFLR